jgi:hypothetical protein
MVGGSSLGGVGFRAPESRDNRKVLPLFLLVNEAIEQRRRVGEKRDFPYHLAYLL